MSLTDFLAGFREDVEKVNGYIDFAYDQDTDGNNLRSEDEIEFLVTSAFLKLFIAWESFLEKTFIAYLTGEESLDGNLLTKYTNPIDENHAHKILIGTQKYVDWANTEIVKRLSGIHFENGEPYSTSLSSIATELSDLRTIRNASAHISSTTQKKLDAVASRVLEVNVAGMSVSEFVTEISKEDVNKTVLQTYQLKLDITAENIAHNRT